MLRDHAAHQPLQRLHEFLIAKRSATPGEHKALALYFYTPEQTANH
jgi:hypothetical protein